MRYAGINAHAGQVQERLDPPRLFPAKRRLLKGETPVQIGDRELDILIALVERASQVVTKRELIARGLAAVWVSN